MSDDVMVSCPLSLLCKSFIRVLVDHLNQDIWTVNT